MVLLDLIRGQYLTLNHPNECECAACWVSMEARTQLSKVEVRAYGSKAKLSMSKIPKVYNISDPNCPPDALYIGRGSPAGNKFRIGPDGTRDEVCDKFEQYAESHPEFKRQLIEYCHGRDLKCFCKPLRCHGDYCLRVSN
jgi:hypothetical protein